MDAHPIGCFLELIGKLAAMEALTTRMPEESDDSEMAAMHAITTRMLAYQLHEAKGELRAQDKENVMTRKEKQSEIL